MKYASFKDRRFKSRYRWYFFYLFKSNFF